MYLSKLKIENFKTENSDILIKLREALETNKIKVHYCVNLFEHSIRYFFSDPIFGSCSFKIYANGSINYENDSSLLPSIPLINTLITYLYEHEINASEETLKRLYPDLYDEEFIKKDMTEKEKEEYDETKNNFNELLTLINKNSNNDIFGEPEKLLIKLSINSNGYYNDTTEYNINVRSLNLKHSYSLEVAFERFILKSYPIEKESKEILSVFAPLYNKSRYFYKSEHDSFTKMTLGQGIKALINQTSSNGDSKPLIFDNINYALDKEIKHLQVSIDKDGNIDSPYIEDVNSFFYDFDIPKEIVYFDKKKHLVTYIILNSDAEKKLLLFKARNPLFNAKYFKKEISQSLVPTIKDVIEVESTFLSESMKKIDHIEYYIDLDKEKLELICKSNYIVGGKDVTLDEFKTKYPKNIDDFQLQLQLLNMVDNGAIKDDAIIANFISASLLNLKKTCQVFVSEDVKKLKKKPISKINIVIESKQDWFSLHFESDEYTEDEINDILSAYKKKKKYYRLRDNILVLDEGNGKDMISLMNDFDLKQEKIPVYQALKLKARQDVTLSKELKELFNKVQNYDDQKISLDKNISKSLRPYQIKGVKWLTVLKENHLSGILADDMGLGKSLEIIAFLSQFNDNKPNLIVCPKSLTYNWENEFNQWNPNAKVVVLSSNKGDRHTKLLEMKNDDTTYIISYDSLRIDLDLFKDKEFGFLILDEGQYIANALAQKSRAVKTINASYKFALTGTPIQNSLMDLWSIFDFLMPGYLKNFNDFKKIYGKFDLSKEERKHLENIVSPFLLKRKKDDVLKELPGKTITTQSLVMDDKEQVLYDAYLSKARNAMAMKQNKTKNGGFEVLSALTRLRQLCVDPSTFLEYNQVSSKLDYTLSLIKEAISKGHKILLFSSFTTVLDHLGDLLDKEKITHETIQGDTSAAKRIKLANDFNTKDDIKVMLISLKAGGTGLNLIGGDIVIHLDPWWNVAAEDQASDRAYRIGQTRKVIIYKLVMKNTIEEKVLKLQEMKKDLSDIFDNINSKTGLSDEDINYLLS